jgi:hypothetical protein|tara:strand:+ start:4029 stop:4253 length:225 start_codon:yes stop_codon:yes gene_type:complete
MVCPAPNILGGKMQYWKHPTLGKIERLEDEYLNKHPDKLANLQENGYTRVSSESDLSPYEVEDSESSEGSEEEE